MLDPVYSEGSILRTQMAPGKQDPFVLGREYGTGLYFPKRDIGVIRFSVINLNIIEIGDRQLNFGQRVARNIFIAVIEHMDLVVQQFTFLQYGRAEYGFYFRKCLLEIRSKGGVIAFIHQMLGGNQGIGLFFGELHWGHGIAIHKGVSPAFEGNYGDPGLH